MGKFRDVRWTWSRGDMDLRTGCIVLDGTMTLSELIEHMATAVPGVPLEEITIGQAVVTWQRPATEEELGVRRAARAAHDRRQEQWEREAYARLAKKYGGPGAAGPQNPGAATGDAGSST